MKNIKINFTDGDTVKISSENAKWRFNYLGRFVEVERNNGIFAVVPFDNVFSIVTEDVPDEYGTNLSEKPNSSNEVSE